MTYRALYISHTAFPQGSTASASPGQVFEFPFVVFHTLPIQKASGRSQRVSFQRWTKLPSSEIDLLIQSCQVRTHNCLWNYYLHCGPVKDSLQTAHLHDTKVHEKYNHHTIRFSEPTALGISIFYETQSTATRPPDSRTETF